MSDGEAVKVAVRVRPFNSREKSMNAKLIIKMSGNTTYITNPEDNQKKDFAFDFSYWSHDGFKEDSSGLLLKDGGSNYASQRIVFDDLGQGVLNNAFEGYNCSLFAYGQTGSGKSYSMVGYGANKGIVPITCDELFKAIQANQDAKKTFEVTFSMLEIYNEQVRDLLVKNNPKGGLSVRQHPSLGFYVDKLKKVPVGSYQEIESRMDEGTKNRTVASTNMNATSSRAHTVVTITFDQVSEAEDGSKMKKSSVMNLVDLAGSERAESTGATGDRLKEGANINKSLSALGNVISALAEVSTGKAAKGKIVPYRDSVLTKLLQNALGGNSKTVMIAALSPADVNYDETLSTLRYADRAKQIKNKATVNESPTDKLIRELREENERMKQLLEGGGMSLAALMAAQGAEEGDVGGQGMSEEEREAMRRELEEQIRREMEQNEKSAQRMEGATQWSSELEEAQQELSAVEQTEQMKAQYPHFTNLNEDIVLSGMITHFLKNDSTKVGRLGDDEPDDISLSGISIKKDHCTISKSEGEIILFPMENAKIKVNGETLTGPFAIKHKDRVLFGLNHLYVFYNPLDKSTRESTPQGNIDWEFASLELTKEQGMAWDAENMNREQQRLRQEIAELYPMIAEVNAISEEMNKFKSFDIVLMANSDASTKGTAKVMVKMTNLLNGNTWLWDRSLFTNRKFIMEEHYHQYSEGDESILSIPKEEDPFWEPIEDVLVGTATFYLQPLSYKIEVDDTMAIYDYKGKSEGKLTVGIYPCNEKGKVIEDDYCEDPDELLGKKFSFKVVLKEGEISKTRFVKGIQVRYSVRGDLEDTRAGDFVASLTPKFKHERMVTFDCLTASELDYLKNGSISFKVFGKQEDLRTDGSKKHMNTKQLRQAEANKSDGLEASAHALMQVLSGDDKKLVSELKILQKKCQTLEGHEDKIKKLCHEYSEKDPTPENFSQLLDDITRVLSLEDRVKEKVKAIGLAARALSKASGRPSAEPSEETQRLYREMSSMMSRVEHSNQELQRQLEDHGSASTTNQPAPPCANQNELTNNQDYVSPDTNNNPPKHEKHKKKRKSSSKASSASNSSSSLSSIRSVSEQQRQEQQRIANSEDSSVCNIL